MNWLDPSPFLRGVAWLDDDGRPVRADPADLARLPWDTAERAALPIGVRLEFTAEGAQGVELRYRASVPGRTDALRELAHCFALWQDGRLVSETIAGPAEEAVVTIPLPTGSNAPFTIHPPETQSAVILGLRAVGGSLVPAPRQPRWLVHGDSITEGWWSTRPAHSWPATTGRTLGLDTVNLGYAGTARGELPIAEQLSDLRADVITLAFGTNCWTGIPCSAPLLYETTRAFLALVRQGHPDTPLLLVSPVLRPDAEQSPNRLGATLAELRAAMEQAVRDRMDGGSGECAGSGGARGSGGSSRPGDKRLALLPGRDLIGPGQLADGVHPNDEGHAAIAAAVAEALRTNFLEGTS
ncbi:GDSL-type esterase/lipase family protein [Streptomyces sp. CA-135486]|uniref:GDSL-type esterase/lipase family protein n=1 Tax=Streptomyces sp. CA-135486 TaxID=3240049 RepID=UPI003D8A21AE